MRFHVLANPMVPLHPQNSFDAYTAKTFRFYEVFAPRHLVTIYGPLESRDFFPRAEYVSVLSYSDYTYDPSDPAVMMPRMEKSAEMVELQRQWESEIKRLLPSYYQPGDCVVHVCDWLNRDHFPIPMLHVTFSVGCCYAFTPYVACETQYLLAALKQQPLEPLVSQVIYPYFNAAEFTATAARESRLGLYLGRLVPSKGYHFVLELARLRPDWTFLCVGGKPKDFVTPTLPNVTVLPPVGPEERSRLLHRATVLLQPSHYPEPCGYNVIEAAIVGRPSIACASGGFLETVKPGVTGYLLPLFPEVWSQYLDRAETLDPGTIAAHGATFTQAESWYQQYWNFFTACRKVYAAMIPGP